MAKVVVLGAGVSGHTASSFLRKWLGKSHSVTVVSPKPVYNWIPSNIWVGVGKISPEKVVFPLQPVYERKNIEFIQARAHTIHPEGDESSSTPFIVAGRTDGSNDSVRVPYDYLVNATGPKLDFGRTPGLGPGHNSVSVCEPGHAVEAAASLKESISKMRAGERQKFVVGTGHGLCTCEGAAWEYVVNLEFELRRSGVRDKAEILFLTNEYEVGDFGMGGMHLKRGGYVIHSKTFTESVFAERGIKWQTRSHVKAVEPGVVHFEDLSGAHGEVPFDFAMLLPPFKGAGFTVFDKSGAEITEKLIAPNGFMKVDANYEQKPFEKWLASDWPTTYQSTAYANVFAAGIAFAPPHGISRPMVSPNGTPIAPAPPRTGMPSASIGKTVARNIVGMIGGEPGPRYGASMSKMGAACVASAGASLWNGSAAAMTVFPIVPDFDTYPDYGRDLGYTFGEIGLSGHWIKQLLHHMFLYKAKLRPGWSLIPE
ncbi:MAG: NAD(P)/FAD-dependent oxidoreductase [Calditrichaeota bacterium]|nr:NAD(P)/FAD-dependent oxidoreductase [Calditrichota bacterium]MCB9366352.1 NAD(P)/FAD-dependent oxidoreductase [Calditrichota bacterium]